MHARALRSEDVLYAAVEAARPGDAVEVNLAAGEWAILTCTVGRKGWVRPVEHAKDPDDGSILIFPVKGFRVSIILRASKESRWPLEAVLPPDACLILPRPRSARLALRQGPNSSLIIARED